VRIVISDLRNKNGQGNKVQNLGEYARLDRIEKA
jgi:hypothetical protein